MWGLQAHSHQAWTGEPKPVQIGCGWETQIHPHGTARSIISILGGSLSRSKSPFQCTVLILPLLHLPADFWVPPHYSSQVSHKAMLDLQCESYNGKYLHRCKSLAYTLAFGNHCVHSALVNCIRPPALGMGMLPLIRMRLRMSILTWPGWDQKSLSQNTQEVSPDSGDICIYIFFLSKIFKLLTLLMERKWVDLEIARAILGSSPKRLLWEEGAGFWGRKRAFSQQICVMGTEMLQGASRTCHPAILIICTRMVISSCGPSGSEASPRAATMMHARVPQNSCFSFDLNQHFLMGKPFPNGFPGKPTR